MAVTRSSHSVSLEVEGAKKAEQDLKSVDAADQKLEASLKKVSEQSNKTGAALSKVGTDAKTSESALNTLANKYNKLEDGVGKVMSKLNGLGDIFKIVGLGIGGGALFGGLQDIAEALKGIKTAAEDAMSGVDLSLGTTGVGALEKHKKAAEEALEAERNLTKGILDRYKAQDSFAASTVVGFLEKIGPGATPEAIREVTRLGSQLESQRQFLKEASETLALRQSTGQSTEQAISEVVRLSGSVAALNKLLDGYTKLSVSSAPARVASRVSAGAKSTVAGITAGDESRYVPGYAGMSADAAFIEKSVRDGNRRRVAEMDQAEAYRLSQLNAPVQGPFQSQDVTPPGIFSWMTSSDAEREKFDADMEYASSRMKEVFEDTKAAWADQKGMLVGLGKGASQAAASAILLGGSFEKAANMMLKSLAVEAGGKAIWETAQGLGSLALAAIGHPGAAAAAGAHFQAAGMYAALAAGAAGGAAASGGLRGGGGGGGAGGRGGNAGGQFGSLAPQTQQNQQPLQITVVLSDEGMYDSMVRVEQGRQTSGSMSRARLAGAV